MLGNSLSTTFQKAISCLRQFDSFYFRWLLGNQEKISKVSYFSPARASRCLNLHVRDATKLWNQNTASRFRSREQRICATAGLIVGQLVNILVNGVEVSSLELHQSTSESSWTSYALGFLNDLLMSFSLITYSESFKN